MHFKNISKFITVSRKAAVGLSFGLTASIFKYNLSSILTPLSNSITLIKLFELRGRSLTSNRFLYFINSKIIHPKALY